MKGKKESIKTAQTEIPTSVKPERPYELDKSKLGKFIIKLLVIGFEKIETTY